MINDSDLPPQEHDEEPIGKGFDLSLADKNVRIILIGFSIWFIGLIIFLLWAKGI